MATNLKHNFEDTHISLNVIEPTNVTGNDAHIARKFWTDQEKPVVNNQPVNKDTKNSWYGQFMSCMEIDWGNAKGDDENNFDKSTISESAIRDILFTNGIKTSDELLTVLCWLFKNRYIAPDPYATISDTTITRPKNTTLSSISWTGGSVSPNSVISGLTTTLNKGTVTATYGNNNGTATITTSNIYGTLSITSSDTSVVTINSVVKNGQTIITGIKNGTAIITVKDGEKTIREFDVIVQNATNTSNVTNSTTFNVSKGSIDGNIITAPNVTSTETVTITATYGGKTAINNISYTVTAATISSIEWVNTTASSTYGSAINLPQIKLNYSNNTNTMINGNASGVTYSTTLTSSNNAGSYSNIIATYQGKQTTNKLNYTINKANLSLTVNITGWQQGNTPNSPSVTGNTGGGSITYKYKVSTAADSTYTITVPTTAGIYIVQASVAATTNYNSGTATKQFTISAPAVSYYWYVGQTNPSSMSSITPIVTDNTSPGWRLIGTSLPTYSSSNKLFEYVEGGEIVTGSSLAKQYIAIPANSSACPRDGLGNDASTVDMYTKLSDVTISGVTYKVYETVGKSKKLAIDIY